MNRSVFNLFQDLLKNRIGNILSRLLLMLLLRGSPIDKLDTTSETLIEELDSRIGVEKSRLIAAGQQQRRRRRLIGLFGGRLAQIELQIGLWFRLAIDILNEKIGERVAGRFGRRTTAFVWRALE